MNTDVFTLGRYDFEGCERFSALAGIIYFLWWFAVELVLPNSFNPLGSRLVVVAIFFIPLVLSRYISFFDRYIREFCLGGIWLLTLHYFYLFWGNGGDSNWVVGCYITVIAVARCFMSLRSLLAYSVFTVSLAVGLMFLIPSLWENVFFPGLVTILLQANLSLRSQIILAKSLAESNKQAEIMKENVKIRDEFISVASHELKTPLTSLKLQAQRIDFGLRNGKIKTTIEVVQSFATTVNRQTEKLNLLVESMLEASRLSSQNAVLNFLPVDLSQIIRQVVSEIRDRYPESSSSILIDVPETFMFVGDQYRLEEVFDNLLSNAVKYGGGKPIVVTAIQDEAQALISVRDQGIGIASEKIPSIFNRFERAISSQNISGLGLGLYIAQQIVEAHGGSIGVESKPEIGSTFTVKLPLRHVS